MKKIILHVFSLALLLGSLTAIAQEGKNKNERKRYEFVKEKNISKTFPASGNQVSIENSFGNVKVIPWDKSEIKVDVHIEASASQEDLAQKIFDAISVNDKQQGNKIEFITEISSKKNKSDDCKNCKSNMHIDYELRLPASIALDIQNSFGNTELPDYTGTVSLTSKFGELTTGALTNVKDLAVEFGNASIKSASNLDATFKFSELSIGNLSGKNKLRVEFCEVSRINLDNNLGSLELDESYSSINIRPGSLSANYTVATNFGNFVDRTSAGIKRTDKPDKYGPDANKTFEGKSGNGAAKIDIRSTFGNIILGEPTAEDLKHMDEKNKNRNKNKSKGSVSL